ncbi:hypothetical protein DPMN_118433 [Dreissena polymorpha]|uniref:Uncharacterized protein n=1 Tax=Dreissena polymorpha TaxID=45954 RepID=A0A9D4GHE6_DREPO|nr:hypothetical protein DPMN_118433 [Dreissena polymorpha]
MSQLSALRKTHTRQGKMQAFIALLVMTVLMADIGLGHQMPWVGPQPWVGPHVIGRGGLQCGQKNYPTYVTPAQVCDGVMHCHDGADELNCIATTTTTCAPCPTARPC